MTGTRFALLAAVIPACLFFPGPVQSSPEVATISGVVADAHGAPLGHAIVTLTGEGIAAGTAFTDDHGRYRFPAIPPHHTCSVAVHSEGFRSVIYEGMSTEAGRTRTVNFRLKHPDDRDIVALVTRDPFPYEEFVAGLETHAGVPVRLIDLDREPDPAETVRRVRAEHPDLIVGAGLRAARLIRREVVDIPSILTLVTDPRRYDLQSATIGLLINQPDADRLFERVESVLPHLHRVGLVYQADTSSLLVRDLKEAAQRRGLTVEFGLCRSQGDLLPALRSMKGRIDALVVPNDDLTSTRRAQEVITSWTLRNHVPLAAPTPDWVERGALFSYGASYERLGEETARVAVAILRGAYQPADFGVQRSKEFELAVNGSTAMSLGLEIPRDLPVETTY
jgi:putative ABC transport system substrate-binding protein